jgi:hypothetical protein
METTKRIPVVGDAVAGYFRTVRNERVPFTGTITSGLGGWVRIAFDAPVAFMPGDERTSASFAPSEACQWALV